MMRDLYMYVSVHGNPLVARSAIYRTGGSCLEKYSNEKNHFSRTVYPSDAFKTKRWGSALKARHCFLVKSKYSRKQLNHITKIIKAGTHLYFFFTTSSCLFVCLFVDLV